MVGQQCHAGDASSINLPSCCWNCVELEVSITKSPTQSLKIYFVQIVTQNCTFLSFIGQVYWRVDSATTCFGLKNSFFISVACWLMSDVATYGHSVLGKSKDQLWLQGKCLHIDGLPFWSNCACFFFGNFILFYFLIPLNNEAICSGIGFLIFSSSCAWLVKVSFYFFCHFYFF